MKYLISLQKILNTPLRLFAVMMVIIFFVELMVMEAMHYWQIEGWYSDLLDATALTIILAPLLFILFVLPLKQQKDRLFVSEGQLRAIAENIPDGLLGIDAKGLIRQANPAALHMFGYEEQELIGKNVSILMSSPYSDEHDGYIANFLRTGERHVVGYLREVEGLRKDGGVIDVELQVAHLPRKKKHFFIGLLRDVSDRKRLDTERQLMRAHMEHTQRLESLGVLAGGVAHDFNNILTAIMGNASLARMQEDVNPELDVMLENIEKSSGRAANLCGQMLAYAGKGRFVVGECHLSDVIKRMQALLRSSMANHISIAFQLAEDLPLIMADDNQLQQVVMNLCLNANEAINGKQDGNVVVRTGSVHLSGDDIYQYIGYEAHRKQQVDGEYVYLEVEDNGGGVDPALMKRIFEPFFSTRFTGRGLGLSACLGVAKSQGGFIQCDNQQGSGMRVRVLFPVNLLCSDFAPLSCALIADNDVPSMRRLSGQLDSLGIRSITANNGEDAVRMFEEHQGQVSLLILKIRLLKLSGVEVLRKIRLLESGIPAILMSSYNEAEGNSRLAHAEGAYFLLKPTEVKNLSHVLATIVANKESKD